MMVLSVLSRKPRHRLCLFAAAMLGVVAVGSTTLLEPLPCALCMTQRLLMMSGVTAVAVGILVHRGRVPRAYPLFAAGCWIAGCVVAFRQIWLQHVPGAASHCGPSLDFLLANDYPLSSIVNAILMGSGDCAEPSVLPLLSLAVFGGMLSLLVIHFKFAQIELSAEIG